MLAGVPEAPLAAVRGVVGAALRGVVGAALFGVDGAGEAKKMIIVEIRSFVC